MNIQWNVYRIWREAAINYYNKSSLHIQYPHCFWTLTLRITRKNMELASKERRGLFSVYSWVGRGRLGEIQNITVVWNVVIDVANFATISFIWEARLSYVIYHVWLAAVYIIFTNIHTMEIWEILDRLTFEHLFHSLQSSMDIFVIPDITAVKAALIISCNSSNVWVWLHFAERVWCLVVVLH